MDLEAYQAAGLYDPTLPRADERRRLLEFLESEGCTVEEMQLAHARGRLFALAGDRRIRPLVGLVSLNDAAASLDVPAEVLIRAWRTFGLPASEPETAILAPADVETLKTFLQVREFLGEDTALGLARVAGAAIARITEAESSAIRMGMQSLDVGLSNDEVLTAQSYSAVTRLVPQIGAMLDATHRQHLEATRVHFEGIAGEIEDRAAFRCGVGFADLSGFTKLSQQLNLGELSMVLSIFEETATETVHARGGRIVKFLGDAVMWVSGDPDQLVQIACDLAHHPKAAEAEIEVRAGVDYGRVLAQDGDYFGVPVNLASRLVALAEPGQVLGTAGLIDVLSGDWQAEPGEPTQVRGFDDPITPYVLTPKT
ncbi:MAG: adenylate cyclase [Frankiales bacterium]|nr:adenylate cyclase [Frankiales bacterium]